MALIAYVRLDLARIATRLARLHSQPYSAANVRVWLRSEGFRPAGDWWQCVGNGLGDLQSDEIQSITTSDEKRLGPDAAPPVQPVPPVPSLAGYPISPPA